MKASVVYLQNVLTPQSRILQTLSEPRTVHELAPHHWQTPYVAFVNGEPVLRAQWELVVEDGTSLAFVDVNAIPQGGGGGSNPLAAILMLAVLVYAPYLAGAVLGDAAAVVIGGTTLGAIGTAVVTMAGMALVNALIPPPKPMTPQSASALAAASPTYSLQAQGNTGRLESAIPEQFGRMVGYPDFAAQPYQEFAGNEQYLYHLLCLGRGQYDIEALRIEDTPVGNFPEISWEVVPPGAQVTLFPTAVTTSVEVSGQSPVCVSATYTQTGYTVTVTKTAHGFTLGQSVYVDFAAQVDPTYVLVPGHYEITAYGSSWVNDDWTFTPAVPGALDGYYTITSAPTPDTFLVTSTVSQTVPTSTCTVSSWVGGFIVNASGTQANALGLDFVAPRGLYYATDSGSLSEVSVSVLVQARTVDAAGSPTGSWVALNGGAPIVYRGATNTPQRYSKRFDVAPDRYEVRVRRVDAESTESRVGNSIVWAGLRAYLPDTRDYGDVTLVALRMRASNNLSSQASRKINVIATRKLPIWNGTAWSAPTATRSPAWAIAYACKQVGSTDAQIDLAALLTLDGVWATRGDRFDARYDAFVSFWEAVSKIAQAGRAKPFMQGGVLRVKRDQAQTIPVALFSMRNIVKGSFGVDYLMPTADTADAVDVAYFDQTTWRPARVRAKLPGSLAARPAKVDLFGVTERDQAFREGMYQAASNRYRRRLVKFTTEMEGFIPSHGDLIAIQHDMPGWGQGGEVTAWDSGTLTLTLSEPLTWGTGTHYIGLRERDGSIGGPYAVTAGAAANQVVLATPPPNTPYTGMDSERTHFSFGWAETWRQRALVLTARPRSLTTVEIEAVVEDENVHTAETGVITPPVVSSQLAGYTNAPPVAGLASRSTPSHRNLMIIYWNPSPWSVKYLVEQSSGDNVWHRSGETTTTNFTTLAMFNGATLVRVAAIGIAQGPWAQIAFSNSPGYVDAPTNYDSFTLEIQPDNTRQFSFAYVNVAPDFDLAGAEIRYLEGTGSTPLWDDMKPLVADPNIVTIDDGFYTRSPVETNLLLAGPYTFALRARDTRRILSATPLYITGTLPDRRLGSIFMEANEGVAGWPGTKTSCEVLEGFLQASGGKTWSNVATSWDVWNPWNQAPASPISYATVPYDFGAVVTGSVNSAFIADGTSVQELRTSNDNVSWSAWVSAGAPFTARYLQVRITITADVGNPVAALREWRFNVSGTLKKDNLNDINIAALTGAYRLGVGDVRAPLRNVYSTIFRATVSAIQDSAPGWTWLLVDRSIVNGPRFKFFKNGVASDPALVDFYIEGY